MSPAFRKGAAASFPQARLTFDKFHVMQLINQAVDTVRRLALKTARAYHLRLAFQKLWAVEAGEADGFIKRWYFWATHSRLKPMSDVARTVRRHQDGILRWFQSRVSNGLLEGVNSLVQAAKAKARGYRSTRNLIAMAYLIAGKLTFRPLPT